MEDNIRLDTIPRDADLLMETLAKGNMAVIRSKNDFLYIVESDGEFQLFAHTPGSPGGGRKQLPKNEKYIAVVRNLVSVSDKVFSVEFDKSLNLYGVMASAEEGILSAFPGEDRDLDEDVEFIIPQKNIMDEIKEGNEDE